METRTFFGVTLEYFGVEMSTFGHSVLISFRIYDGRHTVLVPD